jgi:type VI secretion system protein
MKASLFDVLNGGFVTGQAVTDVREDNHLELSVMGNLNRLFNTRQGSIAHLPDYGLPDIMTIYRDAPQSIEQLRSALKEAVRKYEPRQQRVRVEQVDVDRFEMRLVFIVSAYLDNGDRVKFKTTFESQDSARVQPMGAYA